jgi:hypothetical protein
MERGGPANSPAEAQTVPNPSPEPIGEFTRIAEGVLSPTPEREVHAIAAGWLDLVRNLAIASAFSYVAGISGAWYMQVLAFITETALAAYCFTIVFPYLEQFIVPSKTPRVARALFVTGFVAFSLFFMALLYTIDVTIHEMVRAQTR